MHAVQLDEQAMHVDAVFLSIEYVIDSHAVHFPLTNLYPALHEVQTPVVEPHAEHPEHVVQDPAPLFDHVAVPHALQAVVLPDGE